MESLPLKNINSKQKHNRARTQSKIIHKFQVPQSTGFNESHSAVENVVVITGKLMSPPYGLKAGLNFESLDQQFYFLLPLLCAPPPACLCLSLFCFYLFLSTSYSLCPTQFSLLGLPLQAQVISLKAFDRKSPVVLRSNWVPRMGHDIALPVLTHLPRKRTKDVLTSCDLTVSLRPSSGVEWLKGKKTPINLSPLLNDLSAVVLDPGCSENHLRSYSEYRCLDPTSWDSSFSIDWFGIESRLSD